MRGTRRFSVCLWMATAFLVAVGEAAEPTPKSFERCHALRSWALEKDVKTDGGRNAWLTFLGCMEKTAHELFEQLSDEGKALEYTRPSEACEGENETALLSLKSVDTWVMEFYGFWDWYRSSTNYVPIAVRNHLELERDNLVTQVDGYIGALDALRKKVEGSRARWVASIERCNETAEPEPASGLIIKVTEVTQPSNIEVGQIFTLNHTLSTPDGMGATLELLVAEGEGEACPVGKTPDGACSMATFEVAPGTKMRFAEFSLGKGLFLGWPNLTIELLQGTVDVNIEKENVELAVKCQEHSAYKNFGDPSRARMTCDFDEFRVRSIAGTASLYGTMDTTLLDPGETVTYRAGAKVE